MPKYAMKNIIGILGILLTAALGYHAAVNNIVSTPGACLNTIDAGKTGPQQETGELFFAPRPLGPSARAEQSVKSFTPAQAASKNLTGGLAVVLEIAERLFGSAYIQYTARYANFPIRLRKADLIFPFHCFW